MRADAPVPIAGRFTGRNVLVTGAASGIGRATAERFAAEGASVALADIDLAGVERAAAAIGSAGGDAIPLRLDQADEASITQGLARWGAAGLDIVCINAGVVLVPLRPLERTTPEEWDWLQGVNLRGAFLMARAAIPFLRQRGGGSIVFTASISGLRGHPGSAAYATTKAGVLGLSRSLAAEVAAEGIRVNCVCPGAVASVMGGTLEELAPFAAINPLGRVALPEDIAAAICFLASNDARHITGVELVVDGGTSSKVALPVD